MKILRTAQIKEADAYTIKHTPIKSIDLMERAASACFDWIYEKAPGLFPPHIMGEGEWLFTVVCGPGNNGGDGLAIARMLMRNGYNVEVLIVHYSDKPSKDFETNYEKLGAAAKKQVIHIKKKADIPAIDSGAVLIDALLGSGLNRPAEGLVADAIEAINVSGAKVLSIDLPSGVYADGDFDKKLPPSVRAAHVLTFQSPKLAFFLAEYAESIGQVHVLDIGLHPDFMRRVEVDYHLLGDMEAAQLRKPRMRFSHKGSYGHALIIGGSTGKWGALALATRACVNAGVGLVTAHGPLPGLSNVGAHIPEAMTSTDPSETHFSQLPKLDDFSAIAVGPGLGQHEDSARALKLLIQEAKVPLVLDADALNLIAEHKTWLAFLPKGSILTPHPGEFARLTGEKLSHKEGMERQRELSMKHGIYIVLKGANTSTSTPEGKVWVNSTGNPGMASGGTGDVLTGVIAGLLACGYTPFEAAVLGTYVHGRAGDLSLSGDDSVESLSALTLTRYLGRAFNELTYVA